MKKILYASLVTALLLTACAAQGKTTVTSDVTITPEPTAFVLPVEPKPTVPVKANSAKETPTTQRAKVVVEEKESSVYLNLKKYMELHGLPSQTASKYAKSIEKYATKYKRDPYLVLAIIHVETGSTYKNSTKPNSHGAVGLMQMLERNLECNQSKKGCYNKVWSGYTKADLKDPDRNIELGVSYLKYLQERFGYELGITAYNQGEGNVARGTYRTWYTEKVLKALDMIKRGKENRY